jgi:4-hydroxy-3-polyprenylbenzoate decarboxylase
MGTRSDPQKDFNLLTECWSSRLDTMVFDKKLTNSRVVINACIPYEHIDDFPKVAQTSPELAREVRAKFPDVFA